jgi:hypothetical protein
MDLTPVLVVGFVVLAIYKLFELLVRKRERLTIIEKLSAFQIDSIQPDSIRLPNISFEKQGANCWPLRIALLLIGVGLGCTVAYIVQLWILGSLHLLREGRNVNWEVRNLISMVYFASICFFGGIGLLTAFLVERHEMKKRKD